MYFVLLYVESMKFYFFIFTGDYNYEIALCLRKDLCLLNNIETGSV